MILLKIFINLLKFLSKYINVIIKYLVSSRRFILITSLFRATMYVLEKLNMFKFLALFKLIFKIVLFFNLIFSTSLLLVLNDIDINNYMPHFVITIFSWLYAMDTLEYNSYISSYYNYFKNQIQKLIDKAYGLIHRGEEKTLEQYYEFLTYKEEEKTFYKEMGKRVLIGTIIIVSAGLIYYNWDTITAGVASITAYLFNRRDGGGNPGPAGHVMTMSHEDRMAYTRAKMKDYTDSTNTEVYFGPDPATTSSAIIKPEVNSTILKEVNQQGNPWNKPKEEMGPTLFTPAQKEALGHYINADKYIESQDDSNSSSGSSTPTYKTINIKLKKNYIKFTNIK